MQKFEKVVTRGHATLSDLILSDNSSTILSSMIKVFDDQVLELSRQALQDIQASRSRMDVAASPDPKYLPNPLIVIMVRFHLHTYHFLGSESPMRLSGLIEVYNLACQWTDQASEHDRQSDWALYSSESYFRHIILVAAVILRITKSTQLKSCIDVHRGERAYFAAIKLLKRRSLQSCDVNSKMANMFSQLWHNACCFKTPDGSSDSLDVRTRGRGVSQLKFFSISPLANFQPRHLALCGIVWQHGSDSLVHASARITRRRTSSWHRAISLKVSTIQTQTTHTLTFHFSMPKTSSIRSLMTSPLTSYITVYSGRMKISSGHDGEGVPSMNVSSTHYCTVIYLFLVSALHLEYRD